MFQSSNSIAEIGLDALALKPREVDLSIATSLPVETVVIDYEGRKCVPTRDRLESLAAEKTVVVTVPIRADGFDPLGDDSSFETIPESVGCTLVAGNPAYLDDHERDRAVAPRLGTALERYPSSWVGTEGVERIAMATGATQYELLTATTERDLVSLRAAGFSGSISVYAPTVVSPDDDALLDAVGEYVSRRRPVADRIPPDARTDANASGRVRDVLLDAGTKYALAGTERDVRQRIDALRDAGATTIVGYPAAGLESQ